MATIRDARPSDAPFLAECILAGMHFADFDSDNKADALLKNLTECEGREYTLYSYSRTRIAEVDGKPAGALLSYPGELYKTLRDRMFREFWPAFFTEFDTGETETDPGEYYLDSLAIGHALLKDGIRIGLSEGFTRIALVADAGMPHLIGLYQSIGFVPAEHRHVFGTDFLRMIYSA